MSLLEKRLQGTGRSQSYAVYNRIQPFTMEVISATCKDLKGESCHKCNALRSCSTCSAFIGHTGG